MFTIIINKFISCIGIGLIIAGSILSVAWTCSYGTIFLVALGLSVCSFSLFKKIDSKKMKISKFILKMIVGLFIISFLSTELLIFRAINYDVNTDFDYAIILGAGTVGDKPSLTLKRRLDKALECLSSNDNLKVIVAGGKGKGKDFAESFVMKKYLIDNGIDERRIIEENKSTICKDKFVSIAIIEDESDYDAFKNFGIDAWIRMSEISQINNIINLVNKRLLS